MANNDTIKSSAEAFEQAVSQFNSCMNELQSAYQAMNSAVFMLDGTWNGEASQAFMDKFRDLSAKLATSDETIETALNDITMVVTGHANMEASNSNTWSSAADTTDPFTAG